MANLIESLIAGAVTRQDEARLTITRRPFPFRLRQILELFTDMGPTASIQGLLRAIDFRGADPQTMVYAALGRWPTAAETDAFETPYVAHNHLRTLLRSIEFRTHFVRRAFEAFPERRRLLAIRIPHSLGGQVLATLDSKHPVLPHDFTDARFNDPTVLAQSLGRICGRMTNSNALALIQPHVSAFVDDPGAVTLAGDAIGWHAPVAPCRTGDVLFAIIRDPAERALAQVNATIAAYRRGAASLPEERRATLGLRPKADAAALAPAGWRALGSALLADSLRANPICHALGDGTAAGVRATCLRAPIQLVPPDTYGPWARSTFDTLPADPAPAAEPILTLENLTPADRDHIAAATAEDRAVHDLLTARLKETGLPAAPGAQIWPAPSA